MNNHLFKDHWMNNHWLKDNFKAQSTEDLEIELWKLEAFNVSPAMARVIKMELERRANDGAQV